MKITKNINPNNSSGQAMVLTTVMLGGLMLSVTAIAGLLMFYQLRQANDASSSGQAVFAADAGLEAGLYCYFQEVPVPVGQQPGLGKYCERSGTLPNGARFSSSLRFTFGSGGRITGFILDSFGFSGQTERAVQNTFSNQL